MKWIPNTRPGRVYLCTRSSTFDLVRRCRCGQERGCKRVIVGHNGVARHGQQLGQRLSTYDFSLMLVHQLELELSCWIQLVDMIVDIPQLVWAGSLQEDGVCCVRVFEME